MPPVAPRSTAVTCPPRHTVPVKTDGVRPGANSLFEDNAEFALGMRLTVDKFTEYAKELLDKVAAAGCVDGTPGR